MLYLLYINQSILGCLTVHKPPKVIAAKGSRQVGQATSAERGTLVTLCAIIGCTGKALPPYLIFPRKHFKDHMLKNAPVGSAGNATQSGWMQGDLFEDVLSHFVKYERPTKENPKLILLDNHESHLNVKALDYAKKSGIILLTFPPHCSHRLQPLDLSVFGPFKKYYNNACNRWMTNHPGSVISIYDVAELVGDAFPKAFNVQNINSGFRKAGICPFNDDIFTDADFLPSYVTDRDFNETPISDPPMTIDLSTASISTASFHENPGCSKNVAQVSSASFDKPACSKDNNEMETEMTDNNDQFGSSKTMETNCASPAESSSISGSLQNQTVLPETLRPFAKALPRKVISKRKKGKSMILTSTPIKDELEQRAKERKNKAEKKKTVVRKVLESSSSESGEEPLYEDSSEWEGDEESNNVIVSKQAEDYKKGDYLIVKVYGKKSCRNYAAEITNKLHNGYNVAFLKRQHPSNRFKYSEEEHSFITYEEIVCSLPPPIKYLKGRYENLIYFNYDLSDLSVQ